MLEYLKSANKKINEHTGETIATVSKMLKEIELGGEVIVEEYSKKFDKYTGLLNVSEEQIAKAESSLSSEFKDDIRYAKENVERFALAQRNSLNEFDVEIRPGLIAGQKNYTVECSWMLRPRGTL
jgi:sulfopropanediol 3-dehydrogenase